MSGKRKILAGLVVASSTLLLSLILIAGLVSADPPAQILPTPTLNLTDTGDVEVVEVGGTLETLTFEREEVDGIKVGETAARSEYPNGAIFTVTVESDELVINTVTLRVRYPHNSGARSFAEPTDNPNEWRTVLYEIGGDQPPWQEFDFYWSIADSNGDVHETSRHHFVYSDPARVWYLAEGPYLKLYWFGYGGELAFTVHQRMAAFRERFEMAFGEGLSYKPIAVLFADQTSFAEFLAGGDSRARRILGFTSSDLGMTVQRFFEPGPRSCPQFPPAEVQDDQFVYEYTASVIGHELTHLYQYDKNLTGPHWFTEGAAEWFSDAFRNHPQGLLPTSPDDDLPTLQGIGPSTGASTPSGCNALAYWVGASFHNYVYNVYGMEAIVTWYDRMSRNFLMDDALIEATGKNLAQLERDWRVWLGYPAEVYVRPTDVYRFPPTMTPFGQ